MAQFSANITPEKTVQKEEATVNLDVKMTSVINYALQQNRLPVIREFIITNHRSSDLESVVLHVRSEPEIFLPTTITIALIPAETPFLLSDYQPQINLALLASLTERVAGQLFLTLETDEGEPLAEFKQEVIALAYDEWHGTAFYPELLSSFATPNHPELIKIVARAAQLLDSWTGDPSLDGYQSQNPNRVLAQVAAVYGALQELNLVYTMPPASFERVGQRVRLCDAVIQQNMGTCLDLTLLYASCLESIGLRPILLLQSNHIFAGVWLEKLTFPEPVESDPSLVTKRIAEGVNEIVVVECTALVSGRNLDFDQAVAAATNHLRRPDSIEYIIDITRSRLSDIRPLPQRIQSDTGWSIETQRRNAHELTKSPASLGKKVLLEEAESEAGLTKIAQWERKLLDLSLRNTLINFRWTQSVIPILAESLSDLEDSLAEGADFAISPRPTEWAMTEQQERSIEGLTDLGSYAELIKSEFQNKRLRSSLSEGDLAKAIVKLYRSSRVSLEENGANTLYLALGYLRWYESASSQKPRYAPLVLLPIEIIRRSASIGYVIRLRDEEPEINVTLLEKLERDFGIQVSGLDPLPLDPRGLDLRTIFTMIRRAVMDKARWDVIPAVFLGIFSFSQFVMWNDLRNRVEDLKKNKIVQSLMDNQLAWEAQPLELGERVPEDDCLLPVQADASQLHAIRMATEGKSFVLHGPPGTGKSQTITAIIANALARGKSVLFVAEKMAALSVVYQRLKDIGIGPFCLELHSNKSNKRDVLNQLNEAAQVATEHSASEWLKKAQQTALLRKELDVYVQELHKKNKLGLSLFEMIGEYTRYGESPGGVTFTPELLESLDEECFQNHQLLLDRLIAAAKVIGHPHGHPLRCVGRSFYTQQLRTELPECVENYSEALKELSQAGQSLWSQLAFRGLLSFSDWEKLYQIAVELQVWMPLPRAWAKDPDWIRSSLEMEQMSIHFEKVQSLKRELAVYWDEGVFVLDAVSITTDWEHSQTKWVLPKMLKQNRLIKGFRPHWKEPKKIPKDLFYANLSDLVDYQSRLTSANKLFRKYAASLGELHQNEETDWEKVISYLTQARRSSIELEALTGSDEMRITFAGIRDLFPQIENYVKVYEETLIARDSLYALLDIREDEDSAEGWIATELQICANLQAHASELKEWMVWIDYAKKADDLGLGPLILAYQNGLAHEEVAPAYYKGLYTSIIQKSMEQSPVLNSFSGAVFHEQIRQFRKFDKELMQRSKIEVFYRLAAQVPNFTEEASQRSEVGVLQKAIRSGGRGISIRRLFQQTANLLARLCPCMLMSPLSAAQYLDPNRTPFDLVIFDEASQMPTSRAVGALARGKNAIIVGDPKQMPPTTFFLGTTIDQDNLESEDLESILDDALALNMPETHLLWHYRSRHESLISFSNNQFYDNKLYTFPSADHGQSKVTLVPVDGIFDRGRTRQNRAEAEAIVRELIRRSQDPSCQHQSVGVVTFNSNQQNLIDDLFTEACKANPALESWATEADETIFIKNLENVQGDERDVILFSIAYGPDSFGRTYMHFGPLNREGGWRRLNVAVSRAREEMMVFSSIRPEQIDLFRSSARGVAILREFLLYAENGNLNTTEQMFSGKMRSQSNGIIDALKLRIEQEGYEVQANVGNSKLKVDLAVTDPQQPQRYLLGILLDGPVYKSTKTTRDREISQIDVLQGLGWRIHRLWSVDWWDNREKETQKILELLKSPPVITDGLTEKGEIATEPVSQREPTQIVASAYHDLNSDNKDLVSAYQQYVPSTILMRTLTSDEYLLPEQAPLIQTAIQIVLKQEAPISESLLMRRVVQSFGISRSGSRIQQRTSRILRRMGIKSTNQAGENYYWLPSQDPDSYREFRVSTSDVRGAGDIAVQEVANAVCAVLERQIAMPKEDLLRETATLLGYSRLGTIVAAAMTAGISYAIQTGRIEEQREDYYALSAFIA